jgi:hypothetical protein
MSHPIQAVLAQMQTMEVNAKMLSAQAKMKEV